MKFNSLQRILCFHAFLAVACLLSLDGPNARANCYATDIKFNGVFGTNAVATPQGGTATISYILNEPATNVTINILSGATVVDTITINSNTPGALRGLNTVVWGTTNSAGAPVPNGNYSVTITATGKVYTTWTQISVDDSPGMPANFPQGIAVDKNTNSPYYGRVVMGNAIIGVNTNTPVASKLVGLYKMNADGSQADEGWYGNANYLTSDAGQMSVGGQMGNDGGDNPLMIKIGDDDRIYWIDSTEYSAVLSCDMQASQYQVVIDEGTTGTLQGPYNYSSNPFYTGGEYTAGTHCFDVAFLNTTNASIWMGDNDYNGAFPNGGDWGFWMFHLVSDGTNAANTVNNVLVADPNDTEGTEVVQTGFDLNLLGNGGISVDTNLDIFCGEARQNENAVYDAMEFAKWNGGVFPPEASGTTYTTGTAAGQVAWGYNCGLNTTCATAAAATFETVRDTVVNSRTNPTGLACPMGIGSNNGNGGGIRLLNPLTGAVLTAGTQVLTNLDWHQAYTCADWDNIGNLYAGSTTRNVWRVYSPPNVGSNTFTTVAPATLAVQSLAPTASLPATVFSGNAGGNATSITATFNGTGPFTVQWFAVDPHNNTTTVPSGQYTTAAYSSTLSLTGLSASQNNSRYYLVATDSGSHPVTSTSATLTVYTRTPPALLTFGSTIGTNDPTGWDVNGVATFVTPGVLRLTDGLGSEAGSAFFAEPLDVSGFITTFTYTDVASGRADGVTFCVQNLSPTKVGGGGGSLGVSTITPSAEFELNTYSGNGLGGMGVTYATGGSIARVVQPSPVNLWSGNPINVTIIYTNATMFVNMVDTGTGATYSTTYSGGSSNNITNTLGSTTAYVGFTGADGGTAAYQTISNFIFASYTNLTVTPGPLTGGNLPLSWTPFNFSLVSAPTAQGPWTPVSGTVTTNFVTGLASISPTVTPTSPAEYFSLAPP